VAEIKQKSPVGWNLEALTIMMIVNTIVLVDRT
jgi:hypothetical protein